VLLVRETEKSLQFHWLLFVTTFKGL